MKNIYFKTILSILLFSIISCININNILGYDYEIQSFDIEMNINEDNSFNIKENISAYFNTGKHGIYRTLSLTNIVNRNDGTTDYNSAIVSDVTANVNFTESTSNGDKVIQLGDSYITLLGLNQYIIEYTYALTSADNSNKYDEFYYNLVGTDWDTTINNVSFKITMPKDFNEDNIGFSVGDYGSIGYEDINYYVVDNTIIGNYYGTLLPGEGLTIRVELEEGYFDVPFIYLEEDDYLLIGFCIIMVILSFIIWNKYGKDRQVVETVELYPPEGYNSLDIAYIYKGNIDNKNIISLLLYLANKGYLKIEERKGTCFLSSKLTYLIKLKEYDGTDSNERLFLEGIFKDDKTEVELSELEYKFYTTLSKITKNSNSKKNREKMFEKEPKFISLIMIVSILVILIITILKLNTVFVATSFIILIFPIIAVIILCATFKNSSNPLAVKIFLIVWASGFGGIPTLIFIVPGIISMPYYIPVFLISIIASLIIFKLYTSMERRNEFGTQMLGKIKGFKRYLELAEKEELETRALENPSYFYDILPYAYVLGIDDIVYGKFEKLAIEPPNWYTSDTGVFTMTTLTKSLNETVDRTYKSMNTVHTSSSGSSGGGSGSSGGGSSGGGSGGGGGGSW